jgi:hypothetical protein
MVPIRNLVQRLQEENAQHKKLLPMIKYKIPKIKGNYGDGKIT